MTNPTCCGEHYPGEAGKPLILACQLCPKSQTYWRAARADLAAHTTDSEESQP